MMSRFYAVRMMMKRAPVVRLELLSAVGLSLCLIGGCDTPPVEPSLSDAYRVFGVKAEPPIARPEDTVTLTIYDAHPTQEELLYSWSVCLYSYGGATGFECVSQEFNTQIPNESSPRLEIDLGPEGLDLRGQMSAFAELPDVDGALPSLERGHDVYISILSGLNPTRLTRTIKRLRVIDAPGDEPLALNPTLRGWSISADSFGAERCERTAIGAFSLEDLGEEATLDELIDPNGELLEKGRAYIKREVTGAGEPCVVSAQSGLDVTLDLEAPTGDPLLYEWLADQAPYARPTWSEASLEEGGSVGRYQMPNQTGNMALYFTVRDERGGFAIGHQELTLTAIKSTGSR